MCFQPEESTCGLGVIENLLRVDIVDLDVFFRENPLNVKTRQFNDELEKRCLKKIGKKQMWKKIYRIDHPSSLEAKNLSKEYRDRKQNMISVQ